MESLSQLRMLMFGAESFPAGSAQQNAKVLQLKCLLSVEDASEAAHLHETADAMLDAGAQARRDRLWHTVTNVTGLEKDFCVKLGCLAELDLCTSLLKASQLADLTEDVTTARGTASKAHSALLENLQRICVPAVGPRGAASSTVMDDPGRQGMDSQQPQHQNDAQVNGKEILAQPGPAPLMNVNHSQQHAQARPTTGPGRPGFQQPVQPAPPSHHHALGSGMNAPQWQPGHTNAAGSRWNSAKRPAAQEGDIDADVPASSGPEGAGLPSLGGFQTAKTKLAADCLRKGMAPPNYQQAAPRSGLMRPQKKQQTCQGGGGTSANGFVPPFVKKALDGPSGKGSSGGAHGAGGAGPEVESPYPARLMEMLAERNLLTYGPEGEPVLPEPLSKMDTKIIDHVFNEVLDRSSSIAWDDIAGQHHAKRLVQEMVVWPMLNPQLFKGARSPPRGILLFGPPGTGKTLIGKAVAANISATFFSISASSLTSKWIGEGEKMVRALFGLAGCLQPSVIFIDEIDSLLSLRKAEGEHEASRRMKTQILIEMEGCDPGSNERRVLLIGATNRPEELDEAARRRMPKQLYIPLPCAEARQQMLVNALRAGSDVSHCLSAADLVKVVERTGGYSGSDMKNLIQEACQGPVRDLFRRRGNVSNVTAAELRPVGLRDFQLATKAQKRTVSDAEVERYKEYDEQFGAKYMDVEAEGEGREEEYGDGQGNDEEGW